jgi:hypothetical protein
MEALVAIVLGLDVVGTCLILAAFYLWTHTKRRW